MDGGQGEWGGYIDYNSILTDITDLCHGSRDSGTGDSVAADHDGGDANGGVAGGDKKTDGGGKGWASGGGGD
ncbi:hypothetical protein DM860_007453 [Cuscuta australis]|uniref:Uncharacterized protein n=1 Tax=Cuscuta australis TaxID=267555 RepID=A0A328E425_9ASTE|nr:hypothetical protein DM860_007453 [Cuscuta australis]